MDVMTELQLLKLEHLVEIGKIKESAIIKIIQHSLFTTRRNIEPKLKKSVEDELYKEALSKTSVVEDRKKLYKFYEKYSKLMAERQKDYERQQKQQLNDGLRRRGRVEQLKQGKVTKRKEELNLSSPELMCKVLSSENKKRIVKKAQEKLKKQV